MAYCSSYYLYQRYEKRGDQDWIPSYPNVYSIDGEGSKPLRARQMYDTDCGWIPDTEPIYRWTEIAPTSDPNSYWCDDCPIEPIYRWADSGTTCVGYDKYQRGIKQVSYDNGSTWENVSPAEYSATTLIEAYSVDCGYVPKLYARYSDSTTYSVSCNTSTTLSRSEVTGHSTPYSSMTEASIGDCVDTIGSSAFTSCSGLTSIDIPSGVTSIENRAFYKCSDLATVTIGSGVTSIGNNAFQLCISLTSIDIPDNVTSIGNSAFFNCSGMTSCTIGSGVTSIGSSAFFGCYSLTGITVTAVTPPTLGGSALSGTNNCPIYVPSGSVNDYKTAWSLYDDRIQAIT